MDTHSEYIKLVTFTRQQCLRERAYIAARLKPLTVWEPAALDMRWRYYTIYNYIEKKHMGEVYPKRILRHWKP